MRSVYQPIVVGRREELGQLWELALKGRHTVVWGAAGIGKTVLLEMLYQGLRERGDVLVFRVAHSRQFKSALVELAEQIHERGIYEHPKLSGPLVRAMAWEKLAPKVRGLTVKALAESLVLSLTGKRAVLVWDQFDQATPTELAWLHQFLDTATVILATTDPATAKLKVILDRVPARVEVKRLTEEESHELMEACFRVAPFAVCDPHWYKSEIAHKAQGNPRAIKDLLADHSLEKYIDAEVIRSINSEQGVPYLAISPFVYVLLLAFSIYRYVGRGLGDRDAYIVGAAGAVLFFFLGILVRWANKPS